MIPSSYSTFRLLLNHCQYLFVICWSINICSFLYHLHCLTQSWMTQSWMKAGSKVMKRWKSNKHGRREVPSFLCIIEKGHREIRKICQDETCKWTDQIQGRSGLSSNTSTAKENQQDWPQRSKQAIGNRFWYQRQTSLRCWRRFGQKPLHCLEGFTRINGRLLFATL